MYESMDIEDPLDYTYPQPSPTSKQHSEGAGMYTYIDTVDSEGESLYHIVGPNYEQGYDVAPEPPPVPSRNNTTTNGAHVSNGGPLGSNFYHLLENPEDYNTSLLYEDPTLPTFRVSMFTYYSTA
jgi:hypothetical protein